MHHSVKVLGIAAVICSGLTPLAAHAGTSTADSSQDQTEGITVRRVASDVGAYFTAPLHWDRGDWTLFGGTLAAVALAHHYDNSVRSHFTRGSNTALDGKDPKELQDAVPAAALLAGTVLYGVLGDEQSGRTTAWAMAEATGLSAVTNYLFKAVAGRERPNETTDANRWRMGGSSFPSLHVAGAFAAGTVFAESGSEDSRWLTRTVGYGIASFTVYQRLKHNSHWLSDTVAAAALGASTGLFVVHRTYRTSALAGLTVVPIDGGMMVSYQVNVLSGVNP
jgi:membrane-associated phospholipid phosphatase